MLPALARSITRHPWRFLLAWVLVVGAALLPALGVVGDGLFSRLTSGQATVPGEARTGAELLEAADPSGPTVLAQVDGVDPADPRVQGALAAAVADLGARDGVATAAAPLLPVPGVSPGAPEAVTRSLTATHGGPRGGTDGDGVLVSVTLDPGLPAPAQERALGSVSSRLAALGEDLPGAQVRVASSAGLADVFSQVVEEDLATGEAVALPLSLAVMVVVFGGLLAAGIPLVGALASIAGGLGALTAFTHVVDVDASIVNVVTVLGLGLCIDYGLLVVSRYREELGRAEGSTRAVRDAAVVATVASAGRTVVFSAVTIGVSLSGLLVFRADILRSMGLAAASVVTLALLVALTLVPTLLVLGGERLTRPGIATRVPGLRVLARALGDVAPAEGTFSRLTRRVQRRPWLTVAAVVVVLAALAAPASQLALRSDGVELLPVDNPSRVFFTDLADRYPAVSAPTLTVVARAAPDEASAYRDALAAALPGADVGAPRAAGDLTVIDVRAAPDASDQERRAVLSTVRAERAGFATYATGQLAGTADFTADLLDRAPWAVALVAGATFLLLFLMTGSLLVPVTALVANALSLGAAVGVLTLVFQDGWLEGLLGFSSNGGVESFAVPLTLAFGFGLAMDYEVFLLARVLDARRAGLRTDAAVAAGLQRSGRIITSAALIIVVVFVGFVAGDLLAIKEVGLGLAVAVAIDASLVRMLLVPALMTMLGEATWWAPRPLRAVHDRFGITEDGPPSRP